MNPCRSMPAWALCVTVALHPHVLYGTLLSAQQPPAQTTQPPQPGQPGKNVEWVTTPQPLVEKMLDLAKLTPIDYLIDLGSGDGRLVITAAKRGTAALGIEYDADLVKLAERVAAEAGVSDKATFIKADIFESDFSRATVITMFLLPELNLKLRPTLLGLKPGTRLVSNSFMMGDWQPDGMATLDDCTNWCTALLWIVPAKVEGVWRLGSEELKLTQQFQRISGSLGSSTVAGVVNADQISFSAGGVSYKGRVDGRKMRGSSSDGHEWTAEFIPGAMPERYVPHIYQKGRDVDWVPTPPPLVEKMLDLAKVTPQDYVIDLGAGDGRIVIAAAKRGARALGIEFNPDLVEYSMRAAIEAGVADKAAFVAGDLFASNFSSASVVTLFLLPQINIRLRPMLLDLKPGTRIVSNSYGMGEWRPDRIDSLDNCESWCMSLLWIVPAKVEGTWQLPEGELKLKQQFQVISGTLGSTRVSGAIRGEQVSLRIGDKTYNGRITGNAMEGTIAGGKTEWRATRR